jgi:zinc transporter ZupT
MLRWRYTFLAVVIAAPLGYSFVKPLTNPEISIILGFSSGALISLITEELIPQAYKKAKYHIGLSTTFGFLVEYLLFHFF